MHNTCECGAPLIETMPATRYTPPEWECPVCDGGLTPDELEAQERAYEDWEWRRDRLEEWEEDE